MDLISSFVLAFVQGILEWFPVSSSGHLVLTEKLIGIYNDLSLELALHFGTLMAVFVYFRKDIVHIVRDILSGKWNTPNSRLGFMILIATIPAGVVGFLFRTFFDSASESLMVMGLGWVITGIVLFIGSRPNKKSVELKNFGYFRAFFVGISQMIALIPGVSRSGMTISSGLFFGMKEKESIKFSYLLAIPVIIGANILTFGNVRIPSEFLLPTFICFALGLIFMNFSFRYVLSNRKNLVWFGLYTLILGISCIILGISNVV